MLSFLRLLYILVIGSSKPTQTVEHLVSKLYIPKYFGMYNSETKCSTVWVGLAEPITKMYNNLKKDNTIKLTELF